MSRRDSTDYKPAPAPPRSKHRSLVPAPGLAPAVAPAAPLPPRTGTADVRERSAFRGAAWKPRRLELDGDVLSIINPATAKRTRVPLAAIVAIERTDLAAHALGIRLRASFTPSPNTPSTNNRNTKPKPTGKTQTLALAFATDAALYDWQDDLYARSPLGRYTSGPFDFVHKAHVGADVAGNFGVRAGCFLCPVSLFVRFRSLFCDFVLCSGGFVRVALCGWWLCW
ncbi:hypothetical protein HYPSUDRAFT_42690 [Hypholoma sublateritium FD-334 SS-4]|uniref:CRIB domain-containing protein n=1 Tax=Hypholoma sublateritium (strain FD-334 SS-4) TaxID=945553 RepID=A0A0D2NQ25_HYPSF|nr:hypothetical protein HYPSUDRAFT_42690 [Hypholoma sublateritium FD-334 SS-4]